jgi:hypothetical protein
MRCLDRIRSIADNRDHGELLMDHASSHLAELVNSFNDISLAGSVVYFYTGLLNSANVTMFVQACLACLRSGRADPEDW